MLAYPGLGKSYLCIAGGGDGIGVACLHMQVKSPDSTGHIFCFGFLFFPSFSSTSTLFAIVNSDQPFAEMAPNNSSDFFCFMMEEPFMRTFSITASFTIIALTMVPFYFIIWFERFGPDQTKTFINKLVAMVCRQGNFFPMGCTLWRCSKPLTDTNKWQIIPTEDISNWR